MTATAAKTLDTSAALIQLEVTIDAPKAEVWEAVVSSPDEWWITELRCVPGNSTVTLEPRAGGGFIEENDAGGSLLWFSVIAIDPPNSINLAGAIAPPFGGPCNAYLYIELEEQGESTVVKMTNSLHGHVNEAALPSIEGGWKMLLVNGLKSFVETGKRV